MESLTHYELLTGVCSVGRKTMESLTPHELLTSVCSVGRKTMESLTPYKLLTGVCSVGRKTTESLTPQWPVRCGRSCGRTTTRRPTGFTTTPSPPGWPAQVATLMTRWVMPILPTVDRTQRWSSAQSLCWYPLLTNRMRRKVEWTV